MEDIKELKKWREYYKNQWLKTGRDVYKKKHQEKEDQINFIERPNKRFKDIYSAGMSDEVDISDSNLKNPKIDLSGTMGMIGNPLPIKMGEHEILSKEENVDVISIGEQNLPVNKEAYLLIDCSGITSEHELKEVVTSYLKKYHMVTVKLSNGHRVYRNDGSDGIICEEIFG